MSHGKYFAKAQSGDLNKIKYILAGTFPEQKMCQNY